MGDNDLERFAPGWPGISPRWTSSAKSGIGTALNRHSRVWFTMSHGILNEIYFPRVDQACTRDMGLLVTDGSSFFSEEKRNCKFENVPLEPGVPVYELTNTELQGRYRIEKEIFSDPYRNVVLQKIRFVPLQGTLADYRLYALLAPHLANCGAENTGWVGDYKGTPMLFAQRTECALAFACSAPWKKMAVGFAGIFRRMAGPFPALPDDLGLHPRRKRKRRAHRRDRSGGMRWSLHPGDRLRRHLGGGRTGDARQPARHLRRPSRSLRMALEGMAGQPAEAGRASPRG